MIRIDDIKPFRTIRDKKIARNLSYGTYRVAKIKDINCLELIKVFDSPTFKSEDFEDSKINVEWVIRFTRAFPLMEGIFCIYDWMINENPLDNLEKRYTFCLASKDISDNVVKGFVNDMNEYLVK